ncbi:alpha/beta fold hydrolase [Yinghuangia seranimata]|uniref:alpha/beta fold hydrolase n=1 Tax=Yinghuangia seranimata TaxID=408067 RepID=UPI00248BE86D|nr:alpha/beta hydrolase [Yinghuangia seranimata]MDI2130075.1 alpha/beta hydrolase [Yinghuangia seranimata]
MTDLHIRTHGTGPAVLWIHGYTMDSSTWRPLWDLLPGHRHLGVDLPGHGASGPLAYGTTLPALAARLAELADDEDAVRVVALSFGSLAALQLAADHPDSVERLVLAAPTVAGAPPDLHAARRYRELELLYRMTGRSEAMTDLWMTSPPDIFRGTERHPALRAELRTVVNRHRWTELADGAMTFLTAHRHTDTDLGRITARTLVLVGDDDMPQFTANGQRLREVLPDCRLETVPEAGHLPLLERPGDVAPLLAAHLA